MCPYVYVYMEATFSWFITISSFSNVRAVIFLTFCVLYSVIAELSFGPVASFQNRKLAYVTGIVVQKIAYAKNECFGTPDKIVHCPFCRTKMASSPKCGRINR